MTLGLGAFTRREGETMPCGRRSEAGAGSVHPRSAGPSQCAEPEDTEKAKLAEVGLTKRLSWRSGFGANNQIAGEERSSSKESEST